MLPSVTGRRFLKRKSATEMSAPQSMPSGMNIMLATLCSKPIATNAEIGSHMPSALPARSLAALACQSAKHTIQLQRMPRMKAWPKSSPTLPVATLATEAPMPKRPDQLSMYTTARAPAKLPKKLTIQFLISWPGVTVPSSTAALTSAVLPVKSCPPVITTMSRPTGRPKAPSSIFCRPGLELAMPGIMAPTLIAKAPPRAMKAPARRLWSTMGWRAMVPCFVPSVEYAA
mmetsp:Transcript_45424/g.142363  ORF Transcript_45424/g.142363 Transcript_45424/m.142363 type:complete len:230 (-) Transcript_45424:294-983(-)